MTNIQPVIWIMIDFEAERRHLRQVGFSEGATYHIVEILFNLAQEHEKRLRGLTSNMSKNNLSLARIVKREKKTSNKEDSDV